MNYAKIHSKFYRSAFERAVILDVMRIRFGLRMESETGISCTLWWLRDSTTGKKPLILTDCQNNVKEAVV